MKLNQLQDILRQQSQKMKTPIFIPSLKRELHFRQLSTQDVKVFSRVGTQSDFQLNNQLMKISMFDRLVIQDLKSIGFQSMDMTLPDYLSFLCGIRKMMSNQLKYSFVCKNCEQKFSRAIDTDVEFMQFFMEYQKRKLQFVRVDRNGNQWKFSLKSFNVKSYCYYKYYIEKLKQMDFNNPDILNERVFIRPLLYIDGVSVNGKDIQDWNEQVISTKMKFFNTIPSEVIMNTTQDKTRSDSLSAFIAKNFDQQRLFDLVEGIQTQCPHCKQTYEKLFKLQDMFLF